MGEITIKDIARICGVGVSTVSRAINNHPDINPETRRLVQATIEEYGYIPNNSARNLKRTESNAVAILVKGITNPLFNSMIKVFNEKLKRQKLSMILQQVGPDEDEVSVALELIKEKRLKGLIFLGSNYYHKEGLMDKINVPFVFSTVAATSDDAAATKYSHVAIDDQKESYKVVDYLIGKGHRKIAILIAGERDSTCGRLRLEGYRQAHKDRDIPVTEALIRSAVDEYDHYSMENGYVTTKRLIESGEEFTALFCSSDLLALGAYRAFYEAGIRIPEDVSVVGFDGSPICDFMQPKLTTLEQPVDEMASATFELLYDIMDERVTQQNIVFPGKLVEKDSVRCVK